MAEDPEVRTARLQRQMAHARSVWLEKHAESREAHQSLHVALRKNALKRLMAEAQRRGITRTDLIREIVYEYVDKLPDRERGSGW